MQAAKCVFKSNLFLKKGGRPSGEITTTSDEFEIVEAEDQVFIFFNYLTNFLSKLILKSFSSHSFRNCF